MRGLQWMINLPMVCLVGCTTTLTHQALAPGVQPVEPGFSYYLPRQRFTVTATYELKSCPDATGTRTAAERPLIVSQSATVVETPVADSTQLYSIPLNTLTSGWKTTSLTGTLYDNQTLHSFGATVEDRSGAIVKGVLGTALSIARVAIGVPTAAAATREQLCNRNIYKALEVLEEGQSKLLDPTLDEKARSSWAAAMVSARASLQISETYVFDPTPTVLVATWTPPPEKLLGWFAHPELISSAKNPKEKKQYEQTLQTQSHIKDPLPTVIAVPSALTKQGVIYREPMPVVLEVCAGLCSDSNAEVLVRLDTQAAQFGRYATIPLNNGAFEKNNLSLSFAANGRLETFSFGTESKFEKMATAASDSAASIEGVLAKRKAADEKAAEDASGAELKNLNSEIALLKAKGDKIEAEARLTKLTGGK